MAKSAYTADAIADSRPARNYAQKAEQLRNQLYPGRDGFREIRPPATHEEYVQRRALGHQYHEALRKAAREIEVGGYHTVLNPRKEY